MRTGLMVEVSKRVAGTPAEAFTYFTDPAKHVLWQGVRAELDPRPGGAYVVHMSERSRVSGEYLVVEPPNRLVLSWGWESIDQFPAGSRELPPGSSTVEVTFTPDGDGTLIVLRHTGLPTQAGSDLTTIGWNHYVARLHAVLGGADPGDDPLPERLREMSRD